MSKTLEAELGCFGIHGFGSGVAWGRANVHPGEKLSGKDSYCATDCADKLRCWNSHMQKCRIKFPGSTLIFDKMVNGFGQWEAMRIWKKRNPQTPNDPYLTQMIANAEDGMLVGQGKEPKNRGSLTLTWKPRTK